MGVTVQDPRSDPRLQPTPDYGSLGPGSDLASGRPRAAQPQPARVFQAIMVGIGLAMILVGTGGIQRTWDRLQDILSRRASSSPTSPAALSQDELRRLPAQKQAEALLERALNRDTSATELLAQRVDGWHGRIRMTPHLHDLTNAAFDAHDLSARAAGVELYLAAYNIGKTPAVAEDMQHRADSNDRATRIWALWTLGLLANRGIETAPVTATLIAHLKDDEPASRQWAVEGLAMTGNDAAIAPLLQVFHDDPSPMVRERAGCGIAEGGMLTEAQRRTAIPSLLTFTDDADLDPQTRSWAFRALRDITHQNLPDDPAAWREWYAGAEK